MSENCYESQMLNMNHPVAGNTGYGMCPFLTLRKRERDKDLKEVNITEREDFRKTS